MLEFIKPQFNNLLKPAAKLLQKLHVRPDHVTVAGLALFCAAAWFVYKGNWHISLVLVILGSLFDGLDGVLARESGRKTTFGAILDSSCDRLTEIVLILGVLGYLICEPIFSFSKYVLPLKTRAWGVVFCYTAVTLSLMVSYIKARCEGAGVRCTGGLLQRTERIILLCFGLFLGERAMVFVLALLSGLGAVTVVQRLFEAYKNAQKN